ncbi:retrovirus-related pol polyprotein from transposon TNT 1-94 [Tanacetum coccineum]
MNHQTSTVPQVIPQVAYQSPQAHTQPITESPFGDSCFVVLVFSPGDDSIACLNKAIAFLTAVASSRFPTTNNQLRTSSNPRNQATIQDGRVTLQQVQGRQRQELLDATTAKKAMLAKAQEAGKILDEEQLAFLANPGILADQAQTIIPHNAAFQTKDLDMYDSDCDDLSTAQAVLMANISNYGSDIILEVPNSETYLNDMDNQSVQALQDFKQSPVMDFTDNEISSDSNIIPYSQYLQETQQATVQDTNLQAQQDLMILSVIEQMLNHESSTIKLSIYFYVRIIWYDGVVMSKTHVAMPVIDDEEILILEKESRSKMFEKAKDPEVIAQKISHKPVDYEKLNSLTDDFEKRFSLQQELSTEQAFWFHILNPFIESSYTPPVIVEVPSKLPKVSLVNAILKKLKFHLTQFDSVVKKRTTPNALEEGEWGFEHTKTIFNNEIIPFLKSLKYIFNVFNKDLLNEITKVQIVFDQMDAAVQQSSVDKQCLEIAKKEILLENDRLLQKNSLKNVGLMEQYFEINDLKAWLQDKDKTILENKDLKAQIQDKVFVITSLKNDLRKLKGKQNVENVIHTPSATTIAPGMFKLDLELLPPRFTSTNVVPPKQTTSNSNEIQKPEIKVYSRKPKNVRNIGSSKIAKIVESKNANHLEPNQTWGSNATDIPLSSSLVMTGCPDCTLVSGLRMFKTHDRESLSAHEPYNRTEFANQTLREWYENIGITHQTSVARTPQQNGVVERLVQIHVSQQPCLPPIRDDWDRLFQLMFDEYFNPPPIVVSLVQEAVAPRAEVLADSPVSSSIDQDASSTSIPSSQEHEQSPIIFQGFEESPKIPTFHDDPLNKSPNKDSTPQGSSSNVRQIHTLFEHLGRWTKDHPIENMIGDPYRSVTTRKQLKTDAMWCYFDAFLTSVEPKNFKQAMTKPS